MVWRLAGPGRPLDHQVSATPDRFRLPASWRIVGIDDLDQIGRSQRDRRGVRRLRENRSALPQNPSASQTANDGWSRIEPFWPGVRPRSSPSTAWRGEEAQLHAIRSRPTSASGRCGCCDLDQDSPRPSIHRSLGSPQLDAEIILKPPLQRFVGENVVTAKRQLVFAR